MFKPDDLEHLLLDGGCFQQHRANDHQLQKNCGDHRVKPLPELSMLPDVGFTYVVCFSQWHFTTIALNKSSKPLQQPHQGIRCFETDCKQTPNVRETGRVGRVASGSSQTFF
jgi:hypothetical protein